MGFSEYLAVSLLLFISIEATSSAIITTPTANETTPNKQKRPNNREDELNQEDALGSSHFVRQASEAEELGAAEGTFDPSTDYGSFFDHFADLPYFPEFGEIFRLSRTTTPRPPFGFPAYVRDAFPSRDSIGGSGSGRRQRRPPRPASSGTRTNKVSKQTEPSKEKPPKSKKSSSNPNKARNFPKIFRFTADRVNLADFDMKKKVNENYLALTKGDDLDSDKVKRNEFLILHGGVFEIESRGHKGRPLLTSATHRQSETTPSDFSNSYEESDDSAEELESARYFYKT